MREAIIIINLHSQIHNVGLLPVVAITGPEQLLLAQASLGPGSLCHPFVANRSIEKMVRMGVLSDCLTKIINAERAGKRQVLLRPVSTVVIRFLKVMQKHGYVSLLRLVVLSRPNLLDM